MIFLVIEKTYKDAPTDGNRFNLPADYPMSCLEVNADSLVQVQEKYPGYRVFTVLEYNAYIDGCSHLYKHMQDVFNKKPWWKVW